MDDAIHRSQRLCSSKSNRAMLMLVRRFQKLFSPGYPEKQCRGPISKIHFGDPTLLPRRYHRETSFRRSRVEATPGDNVSALAGMKNKTAIPNSVWFDERIPEASDVAMLVGWACFCGVWEWGRVLKGKQAFLLEPSKGPGARAAERLGVFHARRRLRLPFALKPPVLQQFSSSTYDYACSVP